MKNRKMIFTVLILISVFFFYVNPKIKANKKLSNPKDNDLSSFGASQDQIELLKRTIKGDREHKLKVSEIAAKKHITFQEALNYYTNQILSIQ